MKINILQEFQTLKGQPLKIDGFSGPLTLKDVAAEVLVRGFNGDTLTPAKSLERLKLARRIEATNGDGTIELTTEEASEIKELIARGYAPLISGQAVEMIEG